MIDCGPACWGGSCACKDRIRNNNHAENRSDARQTKTYHTHEHTHTHKHTLVFAVLAAGLLTATPVSPEPKQENNFCMRSNTT